MTDERSVISDERRPAQTGPSSLLLHPSPRRVLAVVRHPLGGVRTHILYTYPILMQAGYRFTFVIPDDESYATFRADVENWPDVEIVEAPYGDRDRQKPKFRSTVRRLLRQGHYSLIHSHGIQAAVPNVFANIGIGLPHLMTSQNVFCHVELSGLAGRIKLQALTHVLRRLDALIAVSEDTRDDHLQYLPGLKKGPCRVEVIPNGIDLQQYPLRNRRPEPGLRQETGHRPGNLPSGLHGPIHAAKRLRVSHGGVGTGPPGRRDAAARATPRRRLRRLSGELPTGPSEVSACFPLYQVSGPRSQRGAGPPRVGPAGGALALGSLPDSAHGSHVYRRARAWQRLRGASGSTPRNAVTDGPRLRLRRAGSRLGVRDPRPWTEAAHRYACEARKRFDVVPAAEKLRALLKTICHPERTER